MSDIVIVGGAGHIGLPLGLKFAEKGQKVVLYDIDKSNLDKISKAEMPFIEYDAEPILKETIGNGNLQCSSDINSIKEAKHIIIAIGTPVDEYLNPKTRHFLEFFSNLKDHISSEQTIIVRSTVYPRTCEQMLKELDSDKTWKIAYCPERIAQGYAIQELEELPQIVSGVNKEAEDDAAKLFGLIASKVIRTTIQEAELAKLFSNAWRYIQFGVTNQFYMIAESFDIDYNKVRHAVTEGYGRAASLPTAGFAAGPCLLKDTMQLAAFQGNNFQLGHAAMFVNEGLPNFLVDRLSKKRDLSQTKVGILGMTFKADIDDTRDSLSYKLGKVLRFQGAEVIYSDEFAKDPTFVSKEELLKSSDVVIIGVPHSAYKKLSIPEKIEVIDLWGIIK